MWTGYIEVKWYKEVFKCRLWLNRWLLTNLITYIWTSLENTETLSRSNRCMGCMGQLKLSWLAVQLFSCMIAKSKHDLLNCLSSSSSSQGKLRWIDIALIELQYSTAQFSSNSIVIQWKPSSNLEKLSWAPKSFSLLPNLIDLCGWVSWID